MTDQPARALRGRGAASNPASRFPRLELEPEEGEAVAPKRTEFLRDASRSVISYNDSPDVGFDASLNPYRGCEHGCSYCYARPTHEYLGFSAGLDFETRILVKEDAPGLLRRELSSSRWKPQVLGLSGVTDPYQPIERRLEITRRCLDVLRELRNPVAVVTKNHLVTRDIDHLAELARLRAAGVFVSITSLDGALHGAMEPRTSHPERRVAALRELSEAGIPTGVLIGPVIPGLNDHEIPAIVEAAAGAGAAAASYIVLRLPRAVAPLFEGVAGATLPRSQGQGAEPHALVARRAPERVRLRRPDARQGRHRETGPLAVRRVGAARGSATTALRSERRALPSARWTSARPLRLDGCQLMSKMNSSTPQDDSSWHQRHGLGRAFPRPRSPRARARDGLRI